MAPKKKEKMTEYERERLENIRRNQELMASLNIQSALSQLSSSSNNNDNKVGRSSSKSYKGGAGKKRPNSSSPIITRRSLRARGMPPDSKGLGDASRDPEPVVSLSRSPEDEVEEEEEKPSPSLLGPYSMRDAYDGSPGSDRGLIDAILSVEAEAECGGEKGVKEGEFDLERMMLEPENVARVVSVRITALKFFPRDDLRMVVAGDKSGTVGFWNVDYRKEDGGEDNDGIYLYRPHTAPVSGVVFQQACSSKMFTSSYDGFLRLMDAEKEVFDLVYRSEEAIFSLAHNLNAMSSLCFGEGQGGLVVWDDRAGKASSNWMLHEARINTIDFNSQNPHMMLTSSTDGTACIWDLRNVNTDKPNSLKTVTHKRAVYSAYFSPSGSMLATTSVDDTVGLVSGINFEDAATIYHYNQTGRWLSTFRAVWGWDDSSVFIGNMKRKIDVISPAERRVVTSLESPNMSAIPCRFDPHPSHVGTLAAATSGGQIYLWTAS